jgi:uncharacterized protein YeeX (DUF496 family)
MLCLIQGYFGGLAQKLQKMANALQMVNAFCEKNRNLTSELHDIIERQIKDARKGVHVSEEVNETGGNGE